MPTSWCSIKYKCVYMSESSTGPHAWAGIGWWMDLYTECRPHSSLDDRSPEEVYADGRAAREPGLRFASVQPEEEAA